jgi:hypothetical protein
MRETATPKKKMILKKTSSQKTSHKKLGTPEGVFYPSSCSPLFILMSGSCPLSYFKIV